MVNVDIGKRLVIWFFWKQKKLCAQAFAGMTAVYCEHSPSKMTISRWMERFTNGWDNVEEATRSSRPVHQTYPITVSRVANAIDEDRRSAVRQLEASLAIPETTIHSILSTEFGMSRVCARWVPKPLSESQ